MYDAIVIGLGGMGSASLYHLARRGLRVLGIEQFDIPHEFGSSHGLSRIIRLAYFESPTYVPLLLRAYELWRELERGSSSKLLYITGGIDAGPEHSETIRGSLRACEEYSLPHELLDAAALSERYPGYQLGRGMLAVLQPEGGFLVPETCVTSHVQAARAEGAEVHTREIVLGWDATPAGVSVRTESASYTARKLVITAGAWARKLIPALDGFAVPERQVVMWTEPLQPELFQTGTFPVFNLQASEDGGERYYGGPMHAGAGFKIGKYHHRREQVDPDSVQRAVSDLDEAVLRRGIERFFPAANGRTLDTKTCLFTNSPDEHFILDTLPDASHVAVGVGFSGHGFKFCSVVGEIMADLAIEGRSPHDIGPFRLNRFDGVIRSAE
jgi:sarcosine oxidase